VGKNKAVIAYILISMQFRWTRCPNSWYYKRGHSIRVLGYFFANKIYM